MPRIALRNSQYTVLTDGTVNGKIDFGTHASYKLNSGAVSFWINKIAGSGTQGALEIAVSSNDRLTLYHSSDVLYFSIVRGGSVLLNSSVTVPNYVLNQHHVLFTWDSNSALVFIDGNTTASLTSSGDRSMNFPSNPQFQVGVNITGAGNCAAYFSNISLYNAKLAGADAVNIYYNNKLPGSLVSYWDFSDGNSTTVSLTSGTGNAGTLGSGASWSYALFLPRMSVRNMDGSMLTPNVSSSVLIPDAVDMRPGANSFGIGLWVDIASLTAGTKVLTEYGTYNVAGWLLNVFDKDLYFYVSSGGPVTSYSKFFANLLFRFVRVWVTVNASDSKVRFYLNGQKIHTSSAISAWNITGSRTLSIGQATTLGSIGMPGYYADVMYCAGSIPTDQEIADEYFLGKVPSSVIHRWKLDETTGTTANDSIGSNNGSLIGSASFVTFSPLKSRNVASTRVSIPNSQNLFLYSDQLDNAYWTKLNSTITQNTDINPIDGLTTIDTITESSDGAPAYHAVYRSAGVANMNNGQACIGGIFKAGTRSWVALFGNGSVGSAGAYFDLANGVVGNTANSTARIRSLGDGWYWCEMSFIQTAAVHGFYIASGNGTVLYQGNGTGSIKAGRLVAASANWVDPYAATAGAAINTGNPRNIVT